MSLKDISSNAEFEKRLRLEALIADLSTKFINLPATEIDCEILDVLRRICELLGLDLLALWQWSDEPPGSFALTHLYSAQEGPLSPGQISTADFPWVTQQLTAGRMVVIASLDELPAEAVRDRESARRLGIKSNLSLPLSVGGAQPIGAFCLNSTRAERDWRDALVQRVQMVAQIFTNALARKRADQALRESEERLSRATDYADVGLWELDPRTGVFWATEKARAIFGYSADEIIDMKRLESSVHPEDWHFVQVSIGRSVQARAPVNAEYRVQLADGRVRWIASRGRPHFTAAGEVERIMGVSMDITDRKGAEEAFRASEARLAAGVDLAGLGYYEVDYGESAGFMDRRFRDICGVPKDLQQGLQPLEFWMAHIHRDDLQHILDERQRLHEGRIDQISAEYRYLHPARGQRWIHHLARIAGPSARAGGVRTFGVIRDITEAKQSQREAQELRDNLAHLARVNTMSVLSGSLAHELNQPLSIILSNAQAAQEMLLQESPDLAEVQSILSDIVSADNRAGAVIRRLRTLLKPGQISLQPLPLNEVIEEVLHIITTDLIGRGIAVVREMAPDLPLVAGDRVQLQQLILNLILNAADAMAANAPGARRLRLKTLQHQGWICTSIRDEGGGLPDVEQIFQPFYTTKAQGLGMGLAICRSITAIHHGRLWGETHPEGGAVFHFELPIVRHSEKS